VSHADTLALLRLTRTEGIGPLTWRRLLAQYGTAAAALAALPGHASRRGAPFTPFPAAAAEAELEKLDAMGGRFLVWGEDDYPPLLALLEDAPPLRAVAGELAEALAAQGIVVTSGLARGIDGAAHEGAIRAGQSVGVVPGGIDIAYPPEHAGLQSALAEAGAVVAEAPLGTAPIARHFPRRNRIIAGLSLGVVVVEAAYRSGTLMTARLALEAGREVFAVPGSPLDPRCAGSNDLIRQGAHLAGGVEDILLHLPDAPREPILYRPKPLPPAVQKPETAREGGSGAAQLLDLIGNSPVTVDELLRRCHLSAAAVQGILLDLELEGRIETLTGNRVVRSD
jgi:DNA processing protein